jgi:hypothetical protein
LLTFIAKARVDQEHQNPCVGCFVDSYKNYQKIQNQKVHQENQMKTISNIFFPFAFSPLQTEQGLHRLRKFLTCLGFLFFFFLLFFSSKKLFLGGTKQKIKG